MKEKSCYIYKNGVNINSNKTTLFKINMKLRDKFKHHKNLFNKQNIFNRILVHD